METFDPELLDALETCTVASVGGTVWRQVLEPTSVMRPNQRGGRWNRQGTEALYCSLEPATTAAEIDALLAAQPIPITRPRVTYAMTIELQRVADLRPDGWIGELAYDYDRKEVGECQVIGAAAAWLGLSAIVVPSIRTVGSNLVVFVANQAPDDLLEVRDQFPYPPGPEANYAWSVLSPR